MFSIFKRKTSLCELLRTGFTDYHSHLLPGIDDGSKCMDDSIQLVQELRNIGAHTIYCTPHVMHSVYNNTPDTINPVYHQLHTEASKVGVQLHVAAEYMLDDGFLKHLEQDKLLSYPEKHVLVEMSYSQAPQSLFDHLFELCTSGYTPVLAHPERYNFYFRDPEAYQRLKDAGCKFQLNLLSLTGYYGPESKETSEWLLENHYYTHIGTDTHKLRHIAALKKGEISKHLKQNIITLIK